MLRNSFMDTEFLNNFKQCNNHEVHEIHQLGTKMPVHWILRCWSGSSSSVTQVLGWLEIGNRGARSLCRIWRSAWCVISGRISGSAGSPTSGGKRAWSAERTLSSEIIRGSPHRQQTAAAQLKGEQQQYPDPGCAFNNSTRRLFQPWRSSVMRIWRAHSSETSPQRKRRPKFLAKAALISSSRSPRADTHPS